MRVVYAVLAAVGAMTAACSSVKVAPYDPAWNQDGVRFYRPAPYLLVSATQAGPMASTIVYLPDWTREFIVRPVGWFGRSDVSVTLEDGWNLTALGVQRDSELPKLITGMPGLLSAFQSTEVRNSAGGADIGPRLYRIRPKDDGVVLVRVRVDSAGLGTDTTRNPSPPTKEESNMSDTENDLRIDYVEFPVWKMKETKRFYHSVFGWSFKDFGPEYASFKDGRLSGGLRKVEREQAAVPGGTLVVLYAVDIEKVETNIREAGGRIVRETYAFPGGRRFHFVDPSGNELAVWSDR